MLKKLFITGLSFFAPAFALAQVTNFDSNTYITGNDGIMNKISDIVNTLVPILIAVGVIVFIVGVLQYVLASKPDEKAKGQQTMIYGIIGLFAIVAVWGLVAILASTFGVDVGGITNSTLPTVPEPTF